MFDHFVGLILKGLRTGAKVPSTLKIVQDYYNIKNFPFTCSKPTLEILQQSYLSKVNNKTPEQCY